MSCNFKFFCWQSQSVTINTHTHTKNATNMYIMKVKYTVHVWHKIHVHVYIYIYLFIYLLLIYWLTKAWTAAETGIQTSRDNTMTVPTMFSYRNWTVRGEKITWHDDKVTWHERSRDVIIKGHVTSHQQSHDTCTYGKHLYWSSQKGQREKTQGQGQIIYIHPNIINWNQEREEIS